MTFRIWVSRMCECTRVNALKSSDVAMSGLTMAELIRARDWACVGVHIHQ